MSVSQYCLVFVNITNDTNRCIGTGFKNRLITSTEKLRGVG